MPPVRFMHEGFSCATITQVWQFKEHLRTIIHLCTPFRNILTKKTHIWILKHDAGSKDEKPELVYFLTVICSHFMEINGPSLDMSGFVVLKSVIKYHQFLILRKFLWDFAYRVYCVVNRSYNLEAQLFRDNFKQKKGMTTSWPSIWASPWS